MFKLKIIFCLLFINMVIFASGFEFNVNIPIGASFGLPNINKLASNYTTPRFGTGFEIGLKTQLGYNISIIETFSISILGELGYSYDTYKQSYKVKDENASGYESISYHSIEIGLLPKFNLGEFSIGIGGGIKIPLSAVSLNFLKKDGRKGYDYYNYNFVEMIRPNTVDSHGLGLFPFIIGYIKLTFDYSIRLADKHYLTVGLYFGYDFMPTEKKKTVSVPNSDKGKDDIYIYKDREGALDLGIQFGYKFAPVIKTIVAKSGSNNNKL